MSKSYRRGGDDRFENRRRRNENRNTKRNWDRREDVPAFDRGGGYNLTRTFDVPFRP